MKDDTDTLRKSEPLWTISEAASYLHVAEKTIIRMAQRGEVPALQQHGQWYFSAPVLTEWLTAQITQPKTVQELLRVDPLAVPIDRLLRPEQILCQCPAKSSNEVRQILTEQIHRKFPEIDPRDYAVLLGAREDLASTTIGNGVALPHIRHIQDNPSGSMDLFLLISAEPIRYGGDLCTVFFLVCTDDIVLHLRLIQKISNLFTSGRLTDLLQSASEPEAVIATLLTEERMNGEL